MGYHRKLLNFFINDSDARIKSFLIRFTDAKQEGMQNTLCQESG